jgi:hypothetical protein
MIRSQDLEAAVAAGIVSRAQAEALEQGQSPSLAAAVGAIALIACLALVALSVDRRALLVSSLLYLGTAVAYVFTSAKVAPALVLSVTLALLGFLVISLGLGWQRLRAALLEPLQGLAFIRKLPRPRP